MARYRRGQHVQVAHGIQRSTGAAWPGDRVMIVGVDSPWIGPDSYDVRTAGGELLSRVPEADLVDDDD